MAEVLIAWICADMLLHAIGSRKLLGSRRTSRSIVRRLFVKSELSIEFWRVSFFAATSDIGNLQRSPCDVEPRHASVRNMTEQMMHTILWVPAWILVHPVYAFLFGFIVSQFFSTPFFVPKVLYLFQFYLLQSVQLENVQQKEKKCNTREATETSQWKNSRKNLILNI